MADPTDVVLSSRPADGVALLTVNRPDKRNALNEVVRSRLVSLIAELAADAAVRAVVLAGADTPSGPAFVAGADIGDLAEAGAIDMLLRDNERLWNALAALPKPLIAAVNGMALGGGCELAMHADIIVAGEGSRFGQPEVRLGIMPGAGGTQRLMRAVGKFKAMKMLLTGAPVDAAEAERIGLVTEVVAADQVLPRSIEIAQQIAAMPPLAVRLIKEAALLGADAPLATALALERRAFQLLFASEDRTEGMRAFLAKRKPVFQGR